MKQLPLIAIQDLTHTFGVGQAARTVLKNVHVDFYPGEIVIVRGPSGAGKTTMLTLAGALRSIQSGSIAIAGKELRGMVPREHLQIRRQIGYIFQHHNLLESLTALENVQMGLAHVPRMPRADSRRKALSFLDRVGLGDHAGKHPSQLSGGQRQRVAIARALVREPAIILADEPTAALDSQSGRDVVDLLQKLAREQHCAILMVTHDDRILDVADRILTLEDGRIEESNRALERLDNKLYKASEAIARYPVLLLSPSPEDAETIRQHNIAELHETLQSAATLVARKGNASMLGKAEKLHAIASLLQHIESDTAHFMARLASQPPPESRMNASDTLLQSLEFLLLTAAETLRSPDADDWERLRALTSDRGTIMEKLRHKYTAQLGDSAATDALFDMTILFARIVHFIHELTVSVDEQKRQ